MFDLGYFVYMDSLEKEDNKNRSTDEKDFEREEQAQHIKKEEQKNICP